MRRIDATLTDLPNDSRLTGSVSGLHLAPPEDPQLHAYVVSFDAGGRTAWHAHERGQLLICTDGFGYVGTRDGHLIELKSGVSVWTDPGEEHWHGAGPQSTMTHVAVQTETPGSDSVRWLEPVASNPWDVQR
ncbi:cupin domain-containing protein [Dactylosporangium sucinum]|uniref:Cupin n=1 Tax=Dactylosporangium sucinum TaxID=1424081 RepID=A0A917WVN8_9ACTN|nr:cupin domain-containing protein [Dactylosporangium sucinum]GGM36726.1 cupin [Dactylosporangium sucinum]